MAFCDTVKLLFYNFKTPFFVQFLGVSQPHLVFIFLWQFAYLAPFNDILCAWALTFVRFCDSVLDRLFLLFSDVFALNFYKCEWKWNKVLEITCTFCMHVIWNPLLPMGQDCFWHVNKCLDVVVGMGRGMGAHSLDVALWQFGISNDTMHVSASSCVITHDQLFLFG